MADMNHNNPSQKVSDPDVRSTATGRHSRHKCASAVASKRRCLLEERQPDYISNIEENKRVMMILPQTLQQAEQGTHCELIVAHGTQTIYWTDTWQNIEE